MQKRRVFLLALAGAIVATTTLATIRAASAGPINANTYH